MVALAIRNELIDLSRAATRFETSQRTMVRANKGNNIELANKWTGRGGSRASGMASWGARSYFESSRQPAGCVSTWLRLKFSKILSRIFPDEFALTVCVLSRLEDESNSAGGCEGHPVRR